MVKKNKKYFHYILTFKNLENGILITDTHFSFLKKNWKMKKEFLSFTPPSLKKLKFVLILLKFLDFQGRKMGL